MESVFINALRREAGQEFDRRKMRSRDLARLLGISERRAQDLTGWMRGYGPGVGMEVALRVVEALGLQPTLEVRRPQDCAA